MSGIMGRAPRVPQQTVNDGREWAATVTRSQELILRQKTFGLVTGLPFAS